VGLGLKERVGKKGPPKRNMVPWNALYPPQIMGILAIGARCVVCLSSDEGLYDGGGGRVLGHRRPRSAVRVPVFLLPPYTPVSVDPPTGSVGENPPPESKGGKRE
jgi:hypothetical protein